jgi:hypothetical protein
VSTWSGGGERVGVCVVRIGRRGPALDIAVTSTSDLRAPIEEKIRTTSLEEALDVVRRVASEVLGEMPGDG